jgi:hypothetical protein
MAAAQTACGLFRCEKIPCDFQQTGANEGKANPVPSCLTIGSISRSKFCDGTNLQVLIDSEQRYPMV